MESRLEPIDEVLAADDIYTWSAERVAATRVRLIRSAVEHHYLNNAHYRSYADAVGFSPGMMTGVDGLDRVPLLPSSLFKRDVQLVRTSNPSGGFLLYATSSGTQGTISQVPRDDVTLMRFFGTVTSALKELIGIDSFHRHVYHLGPKHTDGLHLWTAYAMAGAALLFESTSYVEDGRLLLDRLLSDLRAHDPKKPLAIVGPPPLLLNVAQHVLAAGAPLRVHPDSVTLAFGGWKRRGNVALGREEFDPLVARAFGHPSPARVHDAFNMVELNSVIMDCEHKRKHCPPWLEVSARDPKTLEVLGSGKSGILSYLDPTPTSYPGFLLGDDFGVVERDFACPCGRTSDVVTIERRVNRIEARGCALKMDLSAAHQ